MHGLEMAMRVILLVAFLMGLAGPVGAEAGAVGGSGNKLYQDCLNKESDFLQGYCFGFIIGTALTATSAGIVAGWRVCVPDDVTHGQILDVTMNWLKVHPEKRHFHAAGLVAQALSGAWPCP